MFVHDEIEKDAADSIDKWPILAVTRLANDYHHQ